MSQTRSRKHCTAEKRDDLAPPHGLLPSGRGPHPTTSLHGSCVVRHSKNGPPMAEMGHSCRFANVANTSALPRKPTWKPTSICVAKGQNRTHELQQTKSLFD